MPHVDVDSALLGKTKLCKFFARGHCSDGKACSFAHGRKELRGQPDLFKTEACFRFSHSGSSAAARWGFKGWGVSDLIENRSFWGSGWPRAVQKPFKKAIRCPDVQLGSLDDVRNLFGSALILRTFM